MSTTFSLSKAMEELTALEAWFRSDSIDLSEAVEKHERVGQLVKDITEYLQTIETRITSSHENNENE